eukprot:1562546-Rhodomonas_salina.1
MGEGVQRQAADKSKEKRTADAESRGEGCVERRRRGGVTRREREERGERERRREERRRERGGERERQNAASTGTHASYT